MQVWSALQENQTRTPDRHDNRRIKRPGAFIDAVERADLPKPRGHVAS
jgi:hypothetical protein